MYDGKMMPVSTNYFKTPNYVSLGIASTVAFVVSMCIAWTVVISVAELLFEGVISTRTLLSPSLSKVEFLASLSLFVKSVCFSYFSLENYKN